MMCWDAQAEVGGLEQGRACSEAQQGNERGCLWSLPWRCLSVHFPDLSRVGGMSRMMCMDLGNGNSWWGRVDGQGKGVHPEDFAQVCSVPAAAFAALTLTEQLSTVPCGKPAHSILLLIWTG